MECAKHNDFCIRCLPETHVGLYNILNHPKSAAIDMQCVGPTTVLLSWVGLQYCCPPMTPRLTVNSQFADDSHATDAHLATNSRPVAFVDHADVNVYVYVVSHKRFVRHFIRIRSNECDQTPNYAHVKKGSRPSADAYALQALDSRVESIDKNEFSPLPHSLTHNYWRLQDYFEYYLRPEIYLSRQQNIVRSFQQRRLIFNL